MRNCFVYVHPALKLRYKLMVCIVCVCVVKACAKVSPPCVNRQLAMDLLARIHAAEDDVDRDTLHYPFNPEKKPVK